MYWFLSALFQSLLQTHYIQLGAVVTLGHVISTAVARINRVRKTEETFATNKPVQLEEFIKKSLLRLGQWRITHVQLKCYIGTNISMSHIFAIGKCSL